MRVEIVLTEEDIAKALRLYVASRSDDRETEVELTVCEITVGPHEHPAGHRVTARVSWEES